MPTIVLADDHPIVRSGLRAMLEGDPGYEIVGEAADGRAALDLVERLRPALLIVDVMMPGLGGLEVTRQVTQRLPGTRVIVLSLYSNEAYVLEALRNGAAAYVLKNTSTTALADAVREVMAGHRYLSPPLTERAIQSYILRTSTAADLQDAYEELTGREREVLHLAAEGLSNLDIGQRLHISPRTAETHRANLMHKLNLTSHADLIKYALQRGLISAD